MMHSYQANHKVNIPMNRKVNQPTNQNITQVYTFSRTYPSLKLTMDQLK